MVGAARLGVDAERDRLRECDELVEAERRVGAGQPARRGSRGRRGRASSSTSRTRGGWCRRRGGSRRACAAATRSCELAERVERRGDERRIGHVQPLGPEHHREDARVARSRTSRSRGPTRRAVRARSPRCSGGRVWASTAAMRSRKPCRRDRREQRGERREVPQRARRGRRRPGGRSPAASGPRGPARRASPGPSRPAGRRRRVAWVVGGGAVTAM